MSTPLNRREFLVRAAALGAVTAAGGAFLAACSKPALVCTDTTGVDPAAVALRQAQAYVDKSTTSGRNCTNCSFYQAAADGQCGACTLFAGPINPEGYCNGWSRRA
jgi:hypothetical protein